MMTPPGNEDFLSFSLAPDGSQVAFGAEGKLWTRPLGSVEARQFADSQGAHDPFWSPDSRSVAYFKQNALWVAGIGGGESRYLCPAWNAMGGSWGADGTILFAADFGRAIYRIPAAGGERVPIRLQGEHGTDLRWPSFVPGTSAFIYSSRRAPEQPRTIMAGRLDATGGDHVLLESDANAQVAGDRLLFVRNGRLFAQPFDSARAASHRHAAAGRRPHRLEPLQPRGLRQLLGGRRRASRCSPTSAPGRSIASWCWSIGRAAARRSSAPASSATSRCRPRATSSPTSSSTRWPERATSGRSIWRGGRRRASPPIPTTIWRRCGRPTAGGSTSPRTATAARRSTATPPTAPAATRSSWPTRRGPCRSTSRSDNLLTFTRQDQRRDNDVWVVPLGVAGQGRATRSRSAPRPGARTSRASRPTASWMAYSTTDTGDRHVYIERLDTPGPRVPGLGPQRPRAVLAGRRQGALLPRPRSLADGGEPRPVEADAGKSARRGRWCSCSSAAGTCAITSRRCPTAARS